MARFSELLAAAATVDAAVVADQALLAKDTAGSVDSHAAVVAALMTKTPPKVDLPQADGSVNEITLSPNGADFDITNVPGDFDVEPPAPPA
jgi:hypothetical protein